jgi:hypothetical protein
MYKIELYKPHMIEKVAKLMLPLYGNRLEPYIRWKYHDNPHTDKPLSIVALCNKQIVGFRGYLATPWAIGHDLLAVMCAGDTIVHEKHRMRGLSVKMGQAAFEEFSSYDIFINLSAGNNAVPGYLKLGFHPLVQKVPYSFDFGKRLGAPHYDEPFDSIYESTSLYAERIETPTSNKISIVRDKSYFEWRFNSPRQRYHFYYHKIGDTITDYVALSVRNSLTAYVIDFTDNDPKKLEEIIRYIIATGRYQTLMINRETTNLPLEKLEFTCPKGRHTNPILVQAHDWTVKDVDIREINNWNLSTTYTDDM